MPVSSFSLPAGMQVGSEPSLFSLFVGAVTKRYFQFSGRARRREYWAFNLFYFIGAFLFGCALGFGGVTDENKIRGSIIVFYCFPTAIPSVSILVRRLHDVGISGYLALFYYAWIYGGPAAFLLVFAGINRPKEQFPEFFLTAIAWASGVWGCSLIILYCVIFYYTVKRGGQGTNRFGPDPKLIAGTNHGFGHLGATAPHPVAHHSSSANPLSGQWPSPAVLTFNYARDIITQGTHFLTSEKNNRTVFAIGLLIIIAIWIYPDTKLSIWNDPRPERPLGYWGNLDVSSNYVRKYIEEKHGISAGRTFIFDANGTFGNKTYIKREFHTSKTFVESLVVAIIIYGIAWIRRPHN